MALCKAKAKSGKRCHAKATANGFCSIHQAPGRAAELSKKGVEARRRKAEQNRQRAKMIVAAPQTADELKGIISQVIQRVLAGTIEDSTARAVASLGVVMLKAFDHVDVARELRKLEQLIGAHTPGMLRNGSLM